MYTLAVNSFGIVWYHTFYKYKILQCSKQFLRIAVDFGTGFLYIFRLCIWCRIKPSALLLCWIGPELLRVYWYFCTPLAAGRSGLLQFRRQQLWSRRMESPLLLHSWVFCMSLTQIINWQSLFSCKWWEIYKTFENLATYKKIFVYASVCNCDEIC